MSQKTIETNRLVIRSFTLDDLPVIHRILDQTFGDGRLVDDKSALQERQSWLQWAILNQKWLPQLHQPPYGDRAIILKATGELIGSVGYVPLLDGYDQIPELANASSQSGFNTPEFGLFWVIDPTHQRQGYATEAAQAMIEYAFKQWRLKRVIATTEYSNEASQGVMRKVGMKIAHNPLPDPPWLQVVGIIENGSKMIEIVPYQTRWPAEFQEIALVLRRGLGGLALRIDHIGSTSVPGLPAKDIIDIQITVANLDDQVITAMTALGYTQPEGTWRDHRPPNFTGPEADWEKLFFRPPPGQRPTNTHVRVQGRANQRYALLFRDYLRAHPATAGAYAELKRRLAQHLADPQMYPEVKDPAVDLIYLAAKDWAAVTHWRPGPSDA